VDEPVTLVVGLKKWTAGKIGCCYVTLTADDVDVDVGVGNLLMDGRDLFQCCQSDIGLRDTLRLYADIIHYYSLLCHRITCLVFCLSNISNANTHTYRDR